jgi:hypothetical protein
MNPCMNCLLVSKSQTIQPCTSQILLGGYLLNSCAPKLRMTLSRLYNMPNSSPCLVMKSQQLVNGSWICIHVYVIDD